MEKKSTTATVFALTLFIWLASAATNHSLAADHYRIGTINKSQHYRDDKDFNETHNGIYIVHNRNSFGTYLNSENEQSVFFARYRPINDIFSFTYGVALGYEIGMLPIVGVSAQLSIFKLTLTQDAAVMGLEFSVL